MKNCPFYGRHLVQVSTPFLLIDQHGNQCAMVTDAFAPCSLEIEGKPVQWSVCPRVRRIRITLGPLDPPHAG